MPINVPTSEAYASQKAYAFLMGGNIRIKRMFLSLDLVKGD
jgi:hypothetical protein